MISKKVFYYILILGSNMHIMATLVHTNHELNYVIARCSIFIYPFKCTKKILWRLWKDILLEN
jgi:hypothetical protein